MLYRTHRAHQYGHYLVDSLHKLQFTQMQFHTNVVRVNTVYTNAVCKPTHQLLSLLFQVWHLLRYHHPKQLVSKAFLGDNEIQQRDLQCARDGEWHVL